MKNILIGAAGRIQAAMTPATTGSLRRLAICRQCPLRDARTDKCTRCGCPVTEKTKVAWTSCPVGRWTENFQFPQSA